MSIESYYDIRGHWRLEKEQVEFGSNAIPLELRAPYVKAEEIIKSLPDKSTILDLCCGDGIHSIYPALLGHSVSGVDISKKSIEAARWLAQRHNVLDRCQFDAGDALRFLDNLESHFDLIFISGSLYYFDQEAILQRVRRALKPNGTFICIGTNGGNSWAHIYRLTKQYLTKYRDNQTLHQLLSKKEWGQLATFFPESQLTFYSFATLFGKVLPKTFQIRHYGVLALEKFDQFLLRIPGFWRLGFKFMFWGKNND